MVSEKKSLSCLAVLFGVVALMAALPSVAMAETSASPVPASSAAPEASMDAPAGWEKVGTSEGITVYKKEIPGDPIVALRGEGIVESPITRVASVILDDGRAKEWVDSLEESKLLKMYGEREFLEYTHIGTPFVLKDRDFVTRGAVEADLKARSITVTMKSIEDPLMPPGRYVRGELEGYWILKSLDNDKKTYVITEMRADPKGSVPKWIVNLFQKGWAKNTIESLRKQVAKSDIKVLPEVTKVFRLPGGYQ